MKSILFSRESVSLLQAIRLPRTRRERVDDNPSRLHIRFYFFNKGMRIWNMFQDLSSKDYIKSRFSWKNSMFPISFSKRDILWVLRYRLPKYISLLYTRRRKISCQNLEVGIQIRQTNRMLCIVASDLQQSIGSLKIGSNYRNSP